MIQMHAYDKPQQRPSCRRSSTTKSIERYRDVQTPPEDKFILLVDFPLPLYVKNQLLGVVTKQKRAKYVLFVRKQY